MEPEGSSPHSQVPATCPYPEPAQSSSHILIFQHLATVLISVFTLCYGPGLLFRGPPYRSLSSLRDGLKAWSSPIPLATKSYEVSRFLVFTKRDP